MEEELRHDVSMSWCLKITGYLYSDGTARCSEFRYIVVAPRWQIWASTACRHRAVTYSTCRSMTCRHIGGRTWLQSIDTSCRHEKFQWHACLSGQETFCTSYPLFVACRLWIHYKKCKECFCIGGGGFQWRFQNRHLHRSFCFLIFVLYFSSVSGFVPLYDLYVVSKNKTYKLFAKSSMINPCVIERI